MLFFAYNSYNFCNHVVLYALLYSHNSMYVLRSQSFNFCIPKTYFKNMYLLFACFECPFPVCDAVFSSSHEFQGFGKFDLTFLPSFQQSNLLPLMVVKITCSV